MGSTWADQSWYIRGCLRSPVRILRCRRTANTSFEAPQALHVHASNNFQPSPHPDCCRPSHVSCVLCSPPILGWPDVAILHGVALNTIGTIPQVCKRLRRFGLTDGISKVQFDSAVAVGGISHPNLRNSHPNGAGSYPTSLCAGTVGKHVRLQRLRNQWRPRVVHGETT